MAGGQDGNICLIFREKYAGWGGVGGGIVAQASRLWTSTGSYFSNFSKRTPISRISLRRGFSR